MKNVFTICSIILLSCSCFSQNCEEINDATLNGEIDDYYLENCTSDVSINTPGINTNLYGETLIGATSSINLKATENHKITIKPDDPLDFIGLAITDTFTLVGNHVSESRTNEGNSEGKAQKVIIIYPNPVDDILNIKPPGGITIEYYKIANVYGYTVQEDTLPGPYPQQLELSTFSEGLYYMILYYETDTEVIPFQKN